MKRIAVECVKIWGRRGWLGVGVVYQRTMPMEETTKPFRKCLVRVVQFDLLLWRVTFRLMRPMSPTVKIGDRTYVSHSNGTLMREDKQ